ncbi:putative vacuolar ATPase assembly integral membrane protein [Clavispora lusitaniae]|uniref:Vacuolar ATPase assembly integral membrane protein n=1 Tax=Clavispora lusitaniae TaxID=36911 RepID=A0ACD0WNP5_CLALS|nr:putative vacuolar ATPase assembly integral membrane protein [Clavispora lusitaniae]QFZ34573.1 putative vacuolar ATPase assembly integral membrane protein [Clavispora lusitaniae]QFZ40258.1 putative vacuolar ATPase assembly integral membrane protein [Clavispora lusitaniae]QFZ45938.1 putative vacuolar ATPase assembly integral membrane protein [Clavispora lusitaniae]QFZ51600.1 putative vacuolar ATPase assembly integral membrane protein [Clavispora lusitaniae]
MTQYELTQTLWNLIKSSSLPNDEIDRIASKKSITHKELIRFYREYRPCSSLLELVRSTRMVIPNKNTRNETIPKTKEFLESMELLKLKAKEEEYRKLVGTSTDMNFVFTHDPNEEPFNPSREIKQTRSHVTTIFNIFISVGSVVYAIWYWTDTSWKIKDSYRVLLCLFFGLLILVAEVVVYIGYLNKIEDARIKEKEKKEIKKVVRSITLH